MNEEQIRTLLTELGQRLEAEGLRGEMLIVGGTAMAMAFNPRRQTKDIDAIFEPKARVYEIAAKMADERGLPAGWLNDAAKGFFPQHDSGQRTILSLPGLIVRVPSSEYLFAMKAFAARPEDLNDLRFLAKTLRLRSAEDALTIVEKYYPRGRIPAKTQFFLEEALGPELDR